jgi:hypothetical protein
MVAMNEKTQAESKAETGKTYLLKRNRVFYFAWNVLWVPIRRVLVQSVDSVRSIPLWGRGSTMNTNRYFLRKRISERSPHMKMLLSCVSYIRRELFAYTRSLANMPLIAGVSNYWKGKPFILLIFYEKSSTSYEIFRNFAVIN